MATPGALTRWLDALKLPSWPKLLVPTALGQAIGASESGRYSWLAFASGLLFAALDTVFIVLVNDWADQEVDAGKRRRFPDAGGMKTIPDGLISKERVLASGLFSGGLAVAVAWGAARALERPWFAVAGLLSLLVFVSYSLPPLALNYRGGGELLEALGVGGLLPWMNAYLQCGETRATALVFLPGFVLLSLASAVASGLSDEWSDRDGGKTTFTTLAGNVRARRLVERSAVLGILAWALLPLSLHGRYGWTALPAVLVAAFHLRRAIAASPEAVTNAFPAQRGYKAHLHRAIWQGGLVLAVSLALPPW